MKKKWFIVCVIITCFVVKSNLLLTSEINSIETCDYITELCVKDGGYIFLIYTPLDEACSKVRISKENFEEAVLFYEKSSGRRINLSRLNSIVFETENSNRVKKFAEEIKETDTLPPQIYYELFEYTNYGNTSDKT